MPTENTASVGPSTSTTSFDLTLVDVRRDADGLDVTSAGTGSSHTVCQMPVTGVYQMPPGLLTCLPRGWLPASVGSQTRTTSSFLPVLQGVGDVEA